MWLSFVFLLFGIVLGLLTDISIPEAYTVYLAITVLAVFDTLFGGLRARLEKSFDHRIFISGFLLNLLLALFLTYVGVQLDIDLYLAAVFAFGIRLFQNIAIIRRHVIHKADYFNKKEKSEEK